VKKNKIVPNIKEEKLKELHGKLQACMKVKEMLLTAGWQDVVEKTIEATITNVIGGKVKDVWVSGRISQDKDKSTDYWIGYKQGLTDLYNRIISYKIQESEINNKISEITNQSDGIITPMKDTRYAEK
jgi:hypothetical protein